MTKEGLLKSIAETGYNVGFGAKKHFATYDIVDKWPAGIGVISFIVGVFGLVYPALSAKLPSAILTVAGFLAVCIGLYGQRKGEYEASGKQLTQLFNELRDLYRKVQGGADLNASHAELKDIERRYYDLSISNQIVGSDWYAHYKFFSQHQIDWLDEELAFDIGDKIPLSARLALAFFVLLAVLLIIVTLWPCVGRY